MQCPLLGTCSHVWAQFNSFNPSDLSLLFFFFPLPPSNIHIVFWSWPTWSVCVYSSKSRRKVRECREKGASQPAETRPAKQRAQLFLHSGRPPARTRLLSTITWDFRLQVVPFPLAHYLLQASTLHQRCADSERRKGGGGRLGRNWVVEGLM